MATTSMIDRTTSDGSIERVLAAKNKQHERGAVFQRIGSDSYDTSGESIMLRVSWVLRNLAWCRHVKAGLNILKFKYSSVASDVGAQLIKRACKNACHNCDATSQFD